MDTEDIKQRILSGMDCHHLQLDGDGRHFQALIVSPVFSGLSRVQRQQRVYQTLNDVLASGELHALSCQTLTPDEWSASQHG